MLNTLLVEDDRDLALSVIDHLELEQISCDYAANGIEGAALLTQYRYDVIILDLNMPGMDGLTLCQRLREQGDTTPVLMLTARDTLAQKVEGFHAGTDDYMIKPFEIEELIVRLQALARRRSGQVARLDAGPLSLNLNQRSASLHGEPVRLTPTGFRILEVLLRASPDPVSQLELSRKVWGDDIVDSNKLRVHIHNLRKVLGSAEMLLQTVPGYGFCIQSCV
ncbi:MAG: response regulator transcription factor [Marinobacterium sp.]|nr:response regulator transcription factor [Marinobacterium sp.]